MKHQYPLEVMDAILALLITGVRASQIVLAGGYCRDIVHGHCPNDIDIVVVADEVPNVGDLQVLLPHWELQTVHDSSDDYQSEEPNDFKDRWSAVYQFSTPGLDVDFLFANSTFTACGQAVRMNDYNLNQYMVRVGDIVAGNMPLYVGETPERILKRTHLTKVSEERCNRMRQKARDFGWVVGHE